MEIADKDTLNAKDKWNEVSALLSQQGITFEKFAENIAKMPTQSSLTFVAPQVKELATIHMIIQATDTGKPPLTAFAHVVINILPAK